jgi:hypothetical protein
MREIGSVRADARALDAREIGAAVAAEIDRAIGDAAAALDVALGSPEDDGALTSVCEAILVARERIASVTHARHRAQTLAAQGAELRRQNAETLLRSIRLRLDGSGR